MKMDIVGYGEDALTLWALNKKLSIILQALGDPSTPSQCRALFRPSFGRRGGSDSAQFGEFDFILLSKEHLYLGESKWYRSSEHIKNGNLKLSPVQLLRHKIFKFYVVEWAFGNYSCWHEFLTASTIRLRAQDIAKPIAPDESLLASNLKTVLALIKQHFKKLPPIRNVLLYLYYGDDINILPKSASEDFEVVNIDCSEGALDNFIILSS